MSTLNEIHRIISTNAELFACVGFLAGALLGNWLSIGQEKRKEFNLIADPLAEALTQVRALPTADHTIDFFQFRRTLNRWELFRFDKCLEEYEKAKMNAQLKTYDNGGPLLIVGSGRYQDTTKIVAAIDKLLQFTKRK